MSLNIALETLLAASEKVTIDGSDYSLQTYLWRNLMPGSDTSERGLNAIIQVVALEQQSFPTTLQAEHLWVIKDQEIWETSFLEEERTPEAPNQLERLANGGPVWDGQVTVVVQLSTTNGQKYLLKVDKQRINKTF